MAIDWRITAVGQEANGGRRFVTVEITANGIGPSPISKNINHIDPTQPGYREQIRFYVRGYVQGLRAMRRQQQDMPKVPAMSAPEIAALVAAGTDADSEA